VLCARLLWYLYDMHLLCYCKGGARRTTKSADFCGRGLVARQDRPTKSVNHDTRRIFLFATLYDIS